MAHEHLLELEGHEGEHVELRFDDGRVVKGELQYVSHLDNWDDIGIGDQVLRSSGLVSVVGANGGLIFGEAGPNGELLVGEPTDEEAETERSALDEAIDGLIGEQVAVTLTDSSVVEGTFTAVEDEGGALHIKADELGPVHRVERDAVVAIQRVSLTAEDVDGLIDETEEDESGVAEEDIASEVASAFGLSEDIEEDDAEDE